MGRTFEMWKKLVLAGVIVITLHLTANFIVNVSKYDKKLHKREESFILKSLIKNSDGSFDVLFNLKVMNLDKNIPKLRMLDERNIKKVTQPNVAYTPNPPPAIPDTYRGNDICERYQPKLIVYIHSAPSNIVRRTNLRNTWVNNTLFSDNFARMVFVFGRPQNNNIQDDIDAENKEYGDIIQGDFKDHYKNLTFKGLFALKWVRDSCKSAEFILKSDDDAFVNIFEVRKILEKHKQEQVKNFIGCALWESNSMPILRDPKKCMKWCVKDYEFPGENFFPKYCAGLAFMMSSNVVKLMLENAPKTPFFWIDDVYVTGLLPKGIQDLKYINLQKSFSLNANEAIKKYKSKQEKNVHIFVHLKSASLLKSFYKYSYLRLNDNERQKVNFDAKKFANISAD